MADAPATPEMPPDMVASFKHQQENIHEDRTALLIGISWALFALAATAVALRLYAQRIVRNQFRLSDGLILLGLFLTGGESVLSTLGTLYGSGKHLILATPEDLVTIAKLLFAFNYPYIFSNTCIKASVLIFYHRTFPNRTFRIVIWCTGVLVLLWLIANIFGTTFQCAPISFAWDKNQTGSCVNIATMFVILGVINAVTDVFIIIMPLPMIWRLRLPNNRKLGICGIFALSSIVVVASIVRPIYLAQLNTYDITYEGIPIGIWCIVEPTLGIVGACLPLMVPLFKKIKSITATLRYRYTYTYNQTPSSPSLPSAPVQESKPTPSATSTKIGLAHNQKTSPDDAEKNWPVTPTKYTPPHTQNPELHVIPDQDVEAQRSHQNSPKSEARLGRKASQASTAVGSNGISYAVSCYSERTPSLPKSNKQELEVPKTFLNPPSSGSNQS